MMNRKFGLSKMRYAAAAGLFVVASGSGIAVASSGSPEPKLAQDSGTVNDVQKPMYLEAPPVTSVSAINDGALPAAKAGDVPTEMLGTARLAATVDGVNVAIGRKLATRTSPAEVCMAFTENGNGIIHNACAPSEDVGRGFLFTHDVLNETLGGVAPDGVDKVLVTDSNGDTRTALVKNNAYAVKVVGQLARLEWAGARGAHADLQIPVVNRDPVPSPPGR